MCGVCGGMCDDMHVCVMVCVYVCEKTFKHWDFSLDDFDGEM